MSKLKPTVDLGYPTEPYGKIPAFQNIDEEAEFWDTHDITEFDGVELQPVELIVGGELASRRARQITMESQQPAEVTPEAESRNGECSQEEER